ncbi:MAG: glycosyltransferase [Candidatus Eremiobacteraeota bacterium]|nr:glycosyltransferase [Candidatus Eremiobacteraeota bacterium]
MLTASIVVPVYNAAATLHDCLIALGGQDMPQSDFEVIVVDDGSTDDSAALASTFPVRVIRRPNGGAGAARNTGWRAAQGAWIAFTDADCVPARGWLRRLVQSARAASGERPALGAAGKIVGFDSATPAAQFCDIAGSLDAERHLAHPRFPFAPSGNLLYRRAALEAVGGFDERYVSYEACDLHWRLTQQVGGAFVYEPKALVLHRHRASWRSFWRQQFSYGQGYAQFVRYHRDVCRWSVLDELREWGAISKLGLTAWRKTTSSRALYQRGMFVKRMAQRLGFLAAHLNRSVGS